MSQPRILVCDPISEKGLEFLRSSGLSVDVKLGLSEDQLVENAPNYQAMIVRSGVKITARVIEAGTGVLSAIGRAGVGVDNIDIPSATKHGVVVMNTPGGNTISTAEHAFTLMVSMARHIPQAHQSVVEGRFKEGRKAYSGVELYKKTLAIIGMGRIGGELAKRAMGFGMRVVAYDPYLTAAKAQALRVELCETVDLAVEQADFITLHVPKTPETTHIINAERIARMKDGVRIINCARGGLIDEVALLEGIKSGKIAGAAMDVFENEPPSADYELLSRPEMVFTPHLGASTEEAQENVGIEVAYQIAGRLLRGEVVNAVNMPNLDEKTLKTVGPYLELAELLGKFVGQLGPNPPESFRIDYVGKVAEMDTTLISRAALKGFLEVGATPGSANYLNAPSLAEARGLRITESRPSEDSEFTDLIRVIAGNESAKFVVAGTFFGNQPRLVRIDEYTLDASPFGDLLIFKNTDSPGVVGAIGRILGEANVNIANMSLARYHGGGKALSVLNIDSAIDPNTLDKIRAIPGIKSAITVRM